MYNPNSNSSKLRTHEFCLKMGRAESLTIQHKSSLILLELLHSLTLSLALKCFMYFNSQSAL